MRTLAGDHDRFEKTYFEHYKGYYFTGDGCRRDKDGYYWLTGAVFAHVLHSLSCCRTEHLNRALPCVICSIWWTVVQCLPAELAS